MRRRGPRCGCGSGGRDGRPARAADDVRDAFVRALAVAEGGSEARRDALLELADLDLAAGRRRARRAVARAGGGRQGAGHRRARGGGAAAARRRASGRRRSSPGSSRAATDGRAALVQGPRARDAGRRGGVRAARARDGARHAGRERGAVVGARATCRATRRRARACGPWSTRRASRSSRGGGRRSPAPRGRATRRRRALRDAVEAGDAAAARPLLDAAVDDRDRDALAVALACAAGRRSPIRSSPTRASSRRARWTTSPACVHPRVAPWADAILAGGRARVAAGATRTADWPTRARAARRARARSRGPRVRRRRRRPRRRAGAPRAPRHRRRVQRRQEHVHQRAHRRRRRADGRPADDGHAPPPALGAGPLRAHLLRCRGTSRPSASSRSTTCAPR